MSRGNRRALSVLLCLALVTQGPLLLAASSAVPEPAGPSKDAHPPAAPAEVSSHVLDEETGRLVSQRLVVTPLEPEEGLALRYFRDGELVAASSLRHLGHLAVWESSIAGNHLRVVRSVEGMRATEEVLQVWLNGTLLPSFGPWFDRTLRELDERTADELGEDAQASAWAAQAMELLRNEERYTLVSRELADLIGLWRSLIGPGGQDPDGALSCVWCAVGIIGHLAAIGVAVAAGAPTGGAALAAWLIARYSAIAATIGACVECAVHLKELIEEDNLSVHG